eukprot:366263-Chlamydomonas_euryale.AAC.7
MHTPRSAGGLYSRHPEVSGNKDRSEFRGNQVMTGCGAKQPSSIFKDGMYKLAMDWKDIDTERQFLELKKCC